LIEGVPPISTFCTVISRLPVQSPYSCYAFIPKLLLPLQAPSLQASSTPSFFHPKLLPPQASSTPSFSTSKLLHLQASSPYAISCLVSLMPTLSYNPSLPLSVVSCFFLKVIGTEVQFHRRGIKSLKRNLMLASCKA
jgi:hypothetical protein